jgi:hypothetical protein
VIEALGVEAAELGKRLQRLLRDVPFEPRLALQIDEMTHVGRGEDIADPGVVLDVLPQALVGGLAAGADHVDLDVVLPHKAAGNLVGHLLVVVRGVPGQLAFLAGRRLERLQVGKRDSRKQRTDAAQQQAARSRHGAIPLGRVAVACDHAGTAPVKPDHPLCEGRLARRDIADVLGRA